MLEILGALKECRGLSINQIIHKEHIFTYKIELENAYGVILKGSESYIFIDKSITEKYAEFVLLHELGHYFLENDSGSYLCTNNTDMSELRANVYACLMTGSTQEQWIEHGCPVLIAKDVKKFISQNVEQYKMFLRLNNHKEGDYHA